MRIGELAREVGLNTSAIRFYEASGLLPASARGQNRYREYGPDALKRLQFIQLAQRLGFSLDTLRALFAADPAELPKEQILARLEQRRAEIARLRTDLDAQDAELQRLAQACTDSWGRGECVEEARFVLQAKKRKPA